jgi:hypothetical protein
MSELPKYVEKDGCNTPLKKPKHFPKFTTTIFESVNATVTHMEGSAFAPIADSDNFLFVCTCGNLADVLKVQTNPKPLDSEGKVLLYAIDFQMGCPKCGKTGEKTINLKQPTL